VIYKFIEMAKKVSKKIAPTKPRRTSSMEKCLADA